MSISSVVTRGYGTWSTVNKLPTWGYSLGAVVVADPNDGWIASSRVRVSIGTSRERVSIPVSRDRVWITKDKVQE